MDDTERRRAGGLAYAAAALALMPPGWTPRPPKAGRVRYRSGPIVTPAQPRNEPCRCGSGRKFKRCCGGAPEGAP